MRRALATALLVALAGLGASRRAAAGEEPRIRAVTPAHGYRGATVDVAIEGQHLHPFQELKCLRTDLSMTNLGAATPTKVMVRITIPESAEAGPVKITLKTKDGTVSTERFMVRLRTPTVARVQPDAVTRGGEHELVLTGSQLSFDGRETMVTVDPPMTAKVVGKPTEKSLTIKLTVPPEVPTGSKPLVLTTTDGKFATSFTVTPAVPTVSAVRPGAVACGTTTDVVLAGTFLGAAGRVVLTVPDEAIEITNKSAPTPEALSLRIAVRRDAVPGPRLLVVATPDGLASAPLLVTAPQPRIARLQPSGVARGVTTDLDLTLEDAPGEARARFVPEEPGLSVAWARGGPPRVTVAPDAPAGPRTLLIEHPFGLATTTLTVNLKGPTVTGLSPAELAPGAEAEVRLLGQDLDGAQVSLIGTDTGLALAPGAKEGTWTVRADAKARPGPRPLLVRTADGAAIGSLLVTGRVGTVPSLAPTGAHAPRGVPTEIALTGLHLRAAGDQPPTVFVTAPGAPIPAQVVDSTPGSVKIRVTPPTNADLGGAAVVVTTPEGSAAAAFLVVPARPTITGVEPARLVRPGSLPLVVTGTHLVPPGAAPTITLARADGTGALPVVVEASSPERLALRLALDAAAPAGPYLLVVRTSEGGAAAAVTIETAVPVLESIVPDLVGVPANAILVLRGQHLTQPGGGFPKASVTRLGGASNLRPQVIAATPTEVRVRIVTLPGTPAAPHVLVLETADGVTSALFRVSATPQATISTLEPKEGARGAHVIATIRGTGLLAVRTIRFAGEGVEGILLPGGTDSEVRLRISVSAQAATGPRSFSLAGEGGESSADPLVFTVR